MRSDRDREAEEAGERRLRRAAAVEEAMGQAAEAEHHRCREQPMGCPMPQRNDLSRSLVPFQQDGTLVAVVELSRSSWLVAAIVPGLERHPLKKLEPDEDALLRLLHRWRDEAAEAGCATPRLAVAFEAGRDGFWLARWLRAREVEAHVIHPTSIAVSREHRRAKTDRLDTGLLKRAFLGWLRGEPGHCGMAAIPTLAEEDARRPNREREGLVGERTRIINRMRGCLARLGIRGFGPAARDGPAARARDRGRRRDGRHAGARGPPPRPAGPPGGGPLRRADGLAGGERRQAAGEGARQGGQRARAPRHGPARLALPPLPGGQRPGRLVPGADGGRPRRHAQDHDRGPGEEAPGRLVAPGEHRRGARGRRPTPGGVRARSRQDPEDGFATRPPVVWRAADDDPRWR